MSNEKEMDGLILPTKPTKSKLINPSPLLVFGKPKIGKTTAIAALENCLVINLEDKIQTADGMVMYVPTLNDLKIVLQKIKTAGKPYQYIAIDTLN